MKCIDHPTQYSTEYNYRDGTGCPAVSVYIRKWHLQLDCNHEVENYVWLKWNGVKLAIFQIVHLANLTNHNTPTYEP